MSIAKIALTGGIACGKTIVSDIFAKLKFSIIDLDLIAKQVITGDKCLKLLTSYFGNGILNKDASLNRAKLKTLLFDNKNNQQIINNITHPIIIKQMRQKITKLETQNIAMVMVVVPLLFEVKMQGLFDKIIVIVCDSKTQKQRLITRDNIDIVLADKMINSQISNTKRKQLAKKNNAYIINNNSDIVQLEAQIVKLIETFALSY